MLREAASRLLTRTGLLEAKPDLHPRDAPPSPAERQPDDKAGAVSPHPEEVRSVDSKQAQRTMREMEQEFMAAGEHQTEYQHDHFDFAPEPPPETDPVERPEGEDDPALFEPVLDALKTVRDPEIPVNLVDLGLIYELSVKQGGIVYVEMTLTTPACPVAQSMPGEVENAVASVPGVSDVRVKLVWTPPWDRDRMSEEAKLELGLL
jgi:FeS assembly SUF system protein